MTKIPRIGVGVAVLTDTGYILIKRQGSHGAGEWALPGGHLEFGESVENCARREVFEELGVELEDVETYPIFTEDFYPDRHYITLYVFGYTKDTPKIMEPDKASELITLYSCEDPPTPTFSGLMTIWEYIRGYN